MTTSSDDCAHEDFAAVVDVNRMFPTEVQTTEPPCSLVVDVRINCVACGRSVQFEGPMGVQLGRGAHPTVSMDGTELRAAGFIGNNDTPFMGFSVQVSS